MYKLLYFVILFSLWAISGSFGRLPAESTQISETREMGPSPDVTLAPHITNNINLQVPTLSSDIMVITVAPDETCGYLSGQPLLPITCENHSPCMWSSSLGILCGDLSTGKLPDIHLTCLDRDLALNTDLCNDICTSDSAYVLCTHKSAPYCATYAFPHGIQDYRCSSTTASRVSSVFFTYIGQVDASFATTTIDLGASGSVTSASKTTASTSSTKPPSPTIPPNSSHSSQSNLGAIIGGAVGGFVAIALLIFGIVWFVRQSRKKRRHLTLVNPMEQNPLSGPNAGKTGPASPDLSNWRDSTITAMSSPNSASPQTWMNHPVSPSAQSDTSQGIMPTMGQHLTHEMSGESAQPPYEMEDTRVCEMAGDSTRPWV
ncbi:hypothetical protein FSPOR_6095 [Fusarium sporotrichioides]|uniref:Mid2 domain-containing protein n=1 Tax=Fusarium sporotrichioides TaxID=5514 RepID=A0A395S513_FUSSP|nr:hypothetical protein FSPOR_6095 [Fusarium sporotrichioides]